VEEEVEAMLGIREDEAWEGSVIVSKMVIYKDYLENGGGSVRRRQYALGKADGRWNIGEQSRGRQNDPQDLPRAPSAMSSEPAQRLTSFDVTMSSSPDARRQKNMGNPDHPGTNFGKLTKELSARFLLDPGWSHEAEGSGRADGRLQLVSLSRDMGVNPSPLAVRGERGHGTQGSFAAGPSFRRDRFKPRLNLSSHSLGSTEVLIVDCSNLPLTDTLLVKFFLPSRLIQKNLYSALQIWGYRLRGAMWPWWDMQIRNPITAPKQTPPVMQLTCQFVSA
jgi:hypothetical protein